MKKGRTGSRANARPQWGVRQGGRLRRTQLLVIPFSKIENSKLCQNYRTISLVIHFSKVLLKVIQNLISTTVEERLAKQAGFRPVRSKVKQIFNGHILNQLINILYLMSLLFLQSFYLFMREGWFAFDFKLLICNVGWVFWGFFFAKTIISIFEAHCLLKKNTCGHVYFDFFKNIILL